jgi:hypothetical protein
MCIGAAFALQAATIALATIMRNFILLLAPGNPRGRQTMTLPRDGLHMSVRRRVLLHLNRQLPKALGSKSRRGTDPLRCQAFD